MPGPHVTEWLSNSETYRIETDCWENEGADECLARHQEAVEFWQGVYPPDP